LRTLRRHDNKGIRWIGASRPAIRTVFLLGIDSFFTSVKVALHPVLLEGWADGEGIGVLETVMGMLDPDLARLSPCKQRAA
jgi:hypothetical protein